MEVKRGRADYVFGDAQTVDMLDNKAPTARVASVLAEGGTSVDADPMYTATFYFRVSGDARGTFTIGVERGPAASMMTTSKAVSIWFEAGPPAEVAVADPKRAVELRD